MFQVSLSEQEQDRRRAWFHRHFQEGVRFNVECGITIPRWDEKGVEFHLPYRDELSAHEGVFHGGVLASLIDTCGCGAVLAGHDFNFGSRVTTVDMTVQYFAPADGDVIAEGRCTRRGRNLSFADVVVRTAAGKDVAHGVVTVMIAGERRNLGNEGKEGSE